VSLWALIGWEKDRKIPLSRRLPRIISLLGYDPFPEPQTFAEKLIAQRRKLGWSRKFAAVQLGVDEGTLASWEGGTSVPKGHHLNLVRDFMGHALA